MSAGEFYSRVSFEWGLAGNLSYVTAEVRIPGGRVHQRILANSPHKALHGKPLFYSDRYEAKEPLTVYTYCRHGSNACGFFEALNSLYEKIAVDYELLGREFDLLLNEDGITQQYPLRFPFFYEGDLERVRFCRISLPVGDIAVEFAQTPSEATDQLERCARQKELPRSLERPLIGCDLSRTSVLATLMSRLHWAAEIVSPLILEGLARQLSGDAITAG